MFGQGVSQGHPLPRMAQAGTWQELEAAGWPRARSGLGNTGFGTWLRTESAKQTRGQKFLLHRTRCFPTQATAFVSIQVHVAPT